MISGYSIVMNKNNLIWIDLEMTGLDVNKHVIIEIATVITDINLNTLAQGPVLAIYQNNEQLELMNEWNIKTHTSTGLITRVKNSQYSVNDAEEKTLIFLNKWVQKNQSPMCGNSISCDRFFLKKYMPKLEQYFHYRNIDVSSLKELVMRWKPKTIFSLTKTHQALDDTYASISELLHYKRNFFS